MASEGFTAVWRLAEPPAALPRHANRMLALLGKAVSSTIHAAMGPRRCTDRWPRVALLALVFGLVIWTSHGVYTTRIADALSPGQIVLQLDQAFERMGP